MTITFIKSTAFRRCLDNTYQREFYFNIDGEDYCFIIIIPSDKWNIRISKATTYWLKKAKGGNIQTINWGILKKEKISDSSFLKMPVNIRELETETETETDTNIETFTNVEQEKGKDTVPEKTFHCSICGKNFSFKSSLSRHRKKCMLIDYETDIIADISPIDSEPSPSNIHPPETNHTSSLINNSGVTVMNIQNNVNIRSLGKENPRWLTSSLLYQVLSDIPSAIPRLMEYKHFNDDFPENKNIRIDTRRTIDKRLQVFDTGRWRVKDSKQTFYKVLIDIYDILSDALENDLSEPETSEETPDEERLHIYNELTKLKANSRFIQKLERIRPIWEDFRDKIDDQEQRNDLWEDLKTLLLDRRLAIEQGFE
jgi:hypothetical protein